MQCPYCGKDIPVFAKTCPYCRSSSTPLLDGSGGQWDLSGEKDRTSSNASGRGKAGVQSVWKLQRAKSFRQEGTAWEDALSLFVSRKELFQISQMVLHSPHVQSNELYHYRACETSLVFLEGMDAVNAFAADFPLEGLEADPPLIVMFQGMCRATRLISLELGRSRMEGSGIFRDQTAGTIQKIGESMLQRSGDFPVNDAERIMTETGLAESAGNKQVAEWAKSYNAAMSMGILSHELGHIAMGHTLGVAVNSEVSRNQEREADSFAASVISSSPFSDYLVEGVIFFWILLSWANRLAASEEEGLGEMSHPHPKERLYDFLRSNKDQAESLGLTPENVQIFLPEASP